MYDYKSVIVSGTTFVLEGGRWIPVHKSKHATKINAHCDIIYNLILSTNIIQIDNVLFRDYEQCNSRILNEGIDKFVEQKLNAETN